MDSLHLHWRNMLEEEIESLQDLLTKVKVEYVRGYDPDNLKKVGDTITILQGIQDVHDIIHETVKYILK